jgi:GNAT superfamily N-acetyltransferase
VSACSVRIATREDLPAILAVQHEAFGRVADECGIDPSSLPPLVESLDCLERLWRTGTLFFVACDDRTIAGSVRALLKDDVVTVNRLVVATSRLRRGVASSLMDALEAHFSSVRAFELFTGAEAIVPLALYRDRGYRHSHREIMHGVEVVWLAKRVPTSDSSEVPEVERS